MKIETNDSPNDVYLDSKGYMYFFNNKGNDIIPFGWVKSNKMASMFMGQYSFMPVESNTHINDDSGKVNFPMIAWAIHYRTKRFEENPNFKKTKVDCNMPRKCTKYIGIAREETGQTVLFNPKGKLIKIEKGNFKVIYTYGQFGIQLPNAQEVSLPMGF